MIWANLSNRFDVSFPQSLRMEDFEDCRYIFAMACIRSQHGKGESAARLRCLLLRNVEDKKGNVIACFDGRLVIIFPCFGNVSNYDWLDFLADVEHNLGNVTMAGRESTAINSSQDLHELCDLYPNERYWVKFDNGTHQSE